jgi:hypothetical protein
MNQRPNIDTGELMREVARYLVAVEVFRAELCEPTWLPERSPASGDLGSHATPAPATGQPAPRARRGKPPL